jgi:hypothetical protein
MTAARHETPPDRILPPARRLRRDVTEQREC